MSVLISLVVLAGPQVSVRLLPPVAVQLGTEGVYASPSLRGFWLARYPSVHRVSAGGRRLGSMKLPERASVRGICGDGRITAVDQGELLSVSANAVSRLGHVPDGVRVFVQADVLVFRRPDSMSVYRRGREVIAAGDTRSHDEPLYDQREDVLYVLHSPAREPARLTLRRYRGMSGKPERELDLVSGGYYVPRAAFTGMPGVGRLDNNHLLCIAYVQSLAPGSTAGLPELLVRPAPESPVREIAGKGPRLAAVTVALDTGRVRPFLVLRMPLVLGHDAPMPDRFALDRRSSVLAVLWTGRLYRAKLWWPRRAKASGKRGACLAWVSPRGAKTEPAGGVGHRGANARRGKVPCQSPTTTPPTARSTPRRPTGFGPTT